MLIDDNRKSILVRPKGAEVSKGAEISEEGLNMIVLGVRYYPTIKDLLRIEQRENVAMKAKDIIGGIEEFKRKYDENECEGYCAIEISLLD